MTSVTHRFEQILEDAVRETGTSLRTSAHEVAVYAAERAAHLATIVDDPGFLEAVRAERDAVALRAGIAAVRAGDAADARIVGLLQGGLFWAASLLAGPHPA